MQRVSGGYWWVLAANEPRVVAVRYWPARDAAPFMMKSRQASLTCHTRQITGDRIVNFEDHA